MFGYVKPFQPELRVKELDAYKAVYCGLCGQMGRSFGPAARLTLSYDFTFLSMLHASVRGETLKVERRRCYVNPCKCLPICVGGESLCFGADVATSMIYYKLLDNIRDSGKFSSLGWRCLKPVVGQARSKAARARPACDALIEECLNGRQVLLETQKTTGIDAACEPTALALGGIFQQIAPSGSKGRVLERLGYLMGRYVYLCDALDDLPGDVKRGGYNAIALTYNLHEHSGPWTQAREQTACSLRMTIGEMEKTLALLALRDFEPILYNIVTMGLRASVDDILSKKEKQQ